jgi:hypothetical protein
MGNGLLAEWRKGIVVRGLLAAALLAVPVSVAAAIGFEGSLAGLGGGLGSLADGPAETRLEADQTPAASTLGGTIGNVAAVGGRGGGGTPGGGSPSGVDASPVTGGAAPTPGSESAPGATTPGGEGGGQDGGSVLTPGSEVTGPGGAPAAGPNNPVGQLLDDVNETVTGLLGGSR